MDKTVPVTPETKRGFLAWLGLWLQLAVLAALAVFGAALASRDAAPGDYTSGLILAAAAIALALVRIKHTLDGGAPGLGDFVLVDDMWALWIAIPVFVVLALAGLLIARVWEEGTMHTAGIGLFVVSGVIVFLDLKRVFDRLDNGPR